MKRGVFFRLSFFQLYGMIHKRQISPVLQRSQNVSNLDTKRESVK